MFEYQSNHYDPKTDDLFLVYTAIDDSFNANGWRVQDIDKNITSGLGRPGIIKPKDPNNPHEADQNGQFVHPIFPGASLQTLLQNQETYSIARAVRLDKPNPSAPWRVWLQVTDPNAKVALTKNASSEYPKYISPQVITFPTDFPNEEEAKTYKHWIISHWAFVDIPAYGENMKVRGNCYGDLTDCKIKLQNASTGNFCVKEAIHILNSSHNANSQTPSIMAESSNANSSNANANTSSQPIQQSVGGQLYTWQPVVNPTTVGTTTTTDNTFTIQPGHAKQEQEPQSDQKAGRENGDNQNFVKPQNKEEEKDAPIGETADDLKKTISELRKTLSDNEKRTKLLEEDNVIRKQNEKRYQMAAKVAKYSQHFKSKDSFDKEVENLVRFSTVMSEDELEDHLEKKFASMEIKARSASSSASSSAAVATIATNNVHQVPDVQAHNASSVSSDNNRKFLEVMDMFESGGS